MSYLTSISQPSFARIPSTAPRTSMDAQRIIRAQHGDREAFNELVLTYQDIVFRQAYWILSDQDMAEDAAQETFWLAYRKIDIFRGGSFRAWILKITTNHCLDMIRKAKRRLWVSLSVRDEHGEEGDEPAWLKDPAETPDQAVERLELNRAMARSIHNLAPKYRMVIVLVDLQGLDYTEAANVLKIPVGTVKSRLTRARKKLMGALTEYLQPDPK